MLKFGLRSLFALLTFVAVISAWIGNYVHCHQLEVDTLAQISAEHSITYTGRDSIPLLM